MKPQQKKQQQQLREKGFDTFISGANKERVNLKNKNQANPKGRVVKKWNDEKSQSQQIGTLDRDDLEVLRKSLVQGNVLSKSQQDLLEKLQKDTPIDHRYDPHFSQLIDSDEDDDAYIQEEDELCQSEDEDKEQEIYKDDFETTKKQISQPPVQPPPQKVIQVVNLPATKMRPSSALQEQQPIIQQQQQIKQPQTEMKPTFPAKAENKQYASKPQLRANSVTKQEEIKYDNQSFNIPLTAQSSKVQDKKKDNLEELFDKIEKLSNEERQKLMYFLNKNTIEGKTERSEIQNDPSIVKQQPLELPIKQQQKIKENQAIEPKPKEVQQQVVHQNNHNQQQPLQMPQLESKKRNPSVNNVIQNQQEFVKEEKAALQGEKNAELLIDKNVQLKMRILSTWGNPSLVGLTEIELYTNEGNKVQLKSYNIRMMNAQSLKMPEVLINGKSLTKDAVNMWLGSMPDPPKTIDIEIIYDDDVIIGGIKVFNYNKSLIDSVKGVKDLEVLCRQNGKVISKIVEIKKGTGFEIEDYGTEITIIDNFKFPTLQNTQSKFAQKLRGQIDQSDVVEKKQEKLEDSKPPPSRKSRGPIVADVFKGERLDTAKAEKQQAQQPPQQNISQTQNQQVEPRRRRDLQQQPTQDYLEETLQYFNITQQGRLKPVQRQDIIEEPSPLPKYDDVDALDFFFKGQQRNNGQKQQISKWETPQQPQISLQITPQQQQQQPQVRNNARQQTQENALIIKDLLNQPLANQQPKRPKKQVSLPNLPLVRLISIHIHSTWGDKYYVGLNGIEIFNEYGKPIEIQDPYYQVKADPSDINVLPEYSNDPRTPDKLVDGVYFTQNDMHVWLSPFQKGKINKIQIDLGEKKKISMIRIWNYNKSRIHSFRGAKDISLFFDNQIIFRGDIKKGFGSMNLQRVINQNEQPFELFLLTNDENLIQQMSKNDWINSKEFQTIQHEHVTERPNTGNADSEVRPTTSAKVSNLQNEIKQARQLEQNQQRQEKQQIQRALVNQNSNGVICRTFTIKLLKPWADQPYIGLSGIEVYGKEGKIQIKSIKSDYQGDSDKGNLQNLISGANLTTCDLNMYLIPYQPGKYSSITLTFDIPQLVTSIRVWNYNKSYDDTFRGAKFISIISDQGIISNCTALKRAPGCETYDFAQTIMIPCKEYNFEDTNQQVQKQMRCEYEINHMLVGFELKIQLITTYGDIHYIGLNGLEILDYKGRQISGNIGAEPSSVRVLQAMKGDKRVVENLLDGINETQNDTHMWLAPFTNRCFDHSQDPQINTLYFSAEQPFSLGCLIFWNYTKTPTRGVHEIAVSFDDNIIYRGYLRQAGNEGNQTVIMFYKDMQLMEKFSGKYYTEFSQKQSAMYRNEEKGTRQVSTYALLERPITRVKGRRRIAHSVKNQNALKMSNMFTQIQSIVYHQLKIEKALYTKYSQQKVKNFEDFFAPKPVKWVIDFKDQLHLNDKDEYLKKFYPIAQQTNKFKQLLEYYKYHKDIPRMFFGFLADLATYFYEKKKKYEYRKIKIMLGIPYEQSSLSSQYEKLNEDIQVLNSITKLSEKSAKSVLRLLIKQRAEDQSHINIDDTWLTMQQLPQQKQLLNGKQQHIQSQQSQQPQHFKLLKQLVIRNNQINKEKIKLNLPFHLLNGKVLANIRNSQKQSPERPNPTQKSSSQQHINSSQEENEFQKFMKAKIIKLSQENKVKIQKIFSNKIHADQNYNANQAKHSSAHFITSTRSVSSEQLKTEQMRLSQIISSGNNQSQPKLFNYISPTHKKSSSQQSLQTEFTPAKKDKQLVKVYSNNFSNKIKTQPKKTPEKIRKFCKTNSQVSQNSSQKNLMKNLDKLSPFQQFKIMLESPVAKEKRKLQLHNTDTVRLQTEYKQITKRQSITITQTKLNNKILLKKQS